jgi:xylan 1,4-beta-xylosidase
MTQYIQKNWAVYFYILLCGLLLAAQPARSQQTFCNPLNLNYRFMVDAVDAREAADPVIILFKGDYYLFASRSGGYWTSTDLRNWTFIIPTGIDIETYAPAVVVIRDTVFYTPSASNRIYKSADPKSGVWMSGPSIGNYGDPDLFLDDDGRLFMYFGLTNTTSDANIRMVELDPMTFQEMGSPVDLVSSNAKTYGWERRGDDNLLDEQPWIEGSWMTKINGKYYLQFAAPGTEFRTYADGVYVSSDSAKGPYQYASYSPFSFKPTVFISGAGHSCTFKDKDGHYWHISTMTISVKAMFERRLGLFPVAVDADGNIRCNTAFGDYPQYFPGVKSDPINENFAGMLLLSNKKFVTASSSLDDHGIDNAADENARTYWAAQTGDPGEWMLMDLGKECSIQAIQVNFAEHNTNPSIVRGRSNVLYERYIIEKSIDGKNWDMLVDKSSNMKDVPDDYIELASTEQARYLRLTNVFTPGGGNFAVRDLRVFGNSSQAVFTPATDVTVQRDADGRNAVIHWTPVPNADGYIVRYGIAPEKLYNNYMVYDVDSVAIHSLNKGVNYYFGVEAFDSGTDYYSPVGEFRSIKSGNWNDVNTWEQYDGSNWVHPVPSAPAISGGNITIRSGDTITVTASDSADQVVVSKGGCLVINSGVVLLVKDGIGTDLMVNGTIKNSGTITKENSSTISFLDSSRYIHQQNGGSIPIAIWGRGSTCEITGVTTTVPSNASQNFYNFIWNCSGQLTDIDVGWQNNTKISGTLTVKNSNWNHVLSSTPAYQFRLFGASGSCTINSILVNGTNAVLAAQGSDYIDTMFVDSSITLSNGGMLSLSNSTGGITTCYIKGNFTVIDSAYMRKSSSDNLSKFVFNGSGIQNFILPSTGVTFLEAQNIVVDSGSTLNMTTSVFGGTGSFRLNPYATLQTAHIDGINGNITCTGANGGGNSFSSLANYGFNGTAAQVTGSLMPNEIGNLTLNNSAGISLTNSVKIDGTLEIVAGSLSAGSKVLQYSPSGTLKYSGTTSQTTNDAVFPLSNGPGNLSIASTKGVSLHASRSITGNLNLFGKFSLGANTLTANSASSSGTSAFVLTGSTGVLKLTSIGPSPKLYPMGLITYYSPVWISNFGVLDTIGVTVVADNVDAAFGGRVKAKWTISENTNSGGNYTLQFGWMLPLENTAFRSDRGYNAKIFYLSDTTEAGTGNYLTQFDTAPYTVSRGGITTLGSFAVGRFRNMTGVTSQTEQIPVEFQLSQNYPNPFNPTTLISFSIPKDEHVSLKVFNILGKNIVTIVDRNLRNGEYNYEWNASEFASGIYFYRINAGDFVQTKKMLLLK